MTEENYTKLKEMVQSNGNGAYTLVRTDGKKEKVRLFISTNKELCRFIPRSSRRGYLFRGSEYVSAEPMKKKEVNVVKDIRHNLKRISDYLAESGLWKDLKSSADHYLSLTDEELMGLYKMSYGDYMEYNRVHGLTNMNCDAFDRFADKRIIKTINYDNYDFGIKEMFADAIKENRQFSHFWRKGYDNRISCEPCENGDIKRAFYSEEYKNCGNGHYYLALDATHALFYEDD